MTNRIALAATSAALLAGCTANDSPAANAGSAQTNRDCFYLSQVSGYRDGGRDTILVDVGPSRTYEFKTFGACPDLSWSNALAFDKRGPGTICQGMDVDLLVPSSIGPRRCPVSMIRRLPPEPAK